MPEAELAFETQGQAQVVDLEHIEVLFHVTTQRIDFFEEAFTGQVHAEIAELQGLQFKVPPQFVVPGAQHAFIEERTQGVLGVFHLFNAVVGAAGIAFQRLEEGVDARLEGADRRHLATLAHDQRHADEVLHQVLERRFFTGGGNGALHYGFGHLSTAISSSLRLVNALGA
ncbi:hypothetical protein D3C75_849610 [compost metagenome]